MSKKLKCAICGSEENIQMHHVSYNPPKKVPLCSRCHFLIHQSYIKKNTVAERLKIIDDICKSLNTDAAPFALIVKKINENAQRKIKEKSILVTLYRYKKAKLVEQPVSGWWKLTEYGKMWVRDELPYIKKEGEQGEGD